MPLFRRKADAKPARASSISVYGQSRGQLYRTNKSSERSSDSSSFASIDLEDRPPPLAFAEATFDPSLPMKTKSRLSKDLQEVLHDNAALAYFIQFMDAHRAKHLIKFWLEAESFRISLETKRKSQNTPQSASSDCQAKSVFCNSSQAGQHIKPDNISPTAIVTDAELLGASQTVDNGPGDARGSGTGSQSTRTEQGLSLDSGCEEKSTASSLHKKSASASPAGIESNARRLGSSQTLENGEEDVLHARDSVHISLTVKTEQSLSVDSGCDDKLVANSLHKELPKSAECSWSDDECGANELLCDKTLKADQDIDNVLSEKKDRPFKDSIVRLETSIEQDAHSIFSKYLSCDATCPIDISKELQSSIKSNLYQASGVISCDCFVPAQQFVVKKMEEEYFSNFLRSSFHCKHQIDVLTSGTVFLADVLYNDSALFFFMEFMEQEGVHHFVDFLLMAGNFQKHLLSQAEYDGLQAQADAMVIYEKYFSLQATIPLGFSDEIRFEVEANICREEGPLPDCFLKPVKILTQYLEKTYLLQFLNSQLYFKYISECIIIIQTGGTDGDMQQKYTGSDSGSEQSLPISSVNTLLAMESKQLGTSSKIIRNLDDQDMRIDLMQFKPDALWKRPMAGKLQMAHVDHLGRITVDFEPEPDKRRESRISKAVKKLVNWEEDKNQEDMAWKVAEMIVKDICSVTMSGNIDDQKQSIS